MTGEKKGKYKIVKWVYEVNNAGGNNPSCLITIIHRCYQWVYVKETAVVTYKIFKVNE